jgi:hypothetical protein
MDPPSNTKREGNRSGLTVPHARVKRIMKTDVDVQKFTNSAAIAVGCATVRGQITFPITYVGTIHTVFIRTGVPDGTDGQTQDDSV